MSFTWEPKNMLVYKLRCWLMIGVSARITWWNGFLFFAMSCAAIIWKQETGSISEFFCLYRYFEWSTSMEQFVGGCQLETTIQECWYEAGFKLDGNETVEVCEDTTEGCFSVHTGGECTILSGDTYIKKSHAAVDFSLVSEFNVFMFAVHIVQKLLMMFSVPA